jgi:hypothetical protein
MKKAIVFLSAAALVATANVAYAARPDFVNTIQEKVQAKVSAVVAQRNEDRVPALFRARMIPVQQLYFYEPTLIETESEGRAEEPYYMWGKMLYHTRFERFILIAHGMEPETDYSLVLGETTVATGTTNEEGRLLLRGNVASEVWESRYDEEGAKLEIVSDTETVLVESPMRIKQPKVDDEPVNGTE